MDSLYLAAKSDLASWKDEVDKLDIGRLIAPRADSSTTSNVADNNVTKKTVYNKLINKVNAIDISGIVLSI